MIDPLGQKECYAYDLMGRVSAKTDRDGYVTRYAYNPTGDMERITYADGRSVEFTYNALRQLIRIQDWLGITSIEPDPAGRAQKVTDSRGREVSYQWGTMGERETVSYPDGRSVSYEYDELSRLLRLSDGEQEVKYVYDQQGRLSEKQYPDHICTSYRYNPMGYLESLVHQKNGSILESYEYEYDLSGNRTAIRRERRVSPLVSDGIPSEVKEQVCRDNGRYQYHYDCLNRLTEVQKDGTCIRQYEYDAFGNRIRKQEGDRQIRYYYNAADQLIREEGEHSEQTYQYDRRGNLTAVFDGGSMAHRYLYDETGRLSMSMNAEGRLAGYRYNGLGHRTGIQEYALTGAISEPLFPADLLSDVTPVREADYLLDLTREYHNLLERTERNGREESAQSYIWDTNAVFLKEDKITHIYLQDELGSPVRLMQARGEKQTLYGYDEFGNDRYGNQGEMQPFGYTGYQRDRVTGSYFAQAREYLPEVGRFMGQDLIKGMANFPFTLNEYGYCWNNPLMLIDRNGAYPQFIENAKDWWEENIDKTAAIKLGIAGVAAAAAVVATAATFGLSAGIIATAAGTILISGAIGGWINDRNGENPVDGFSGGVLNASIVVLSACMPALWVGSLGMQILMGIVVNTQAAYWGTVMTEAARGKSYEEIKEDAAVAIMGQSYFSGVWGSTVGAVLGTYHPIAVMLSVIYSAAGSIVSDALVPFLVENQNTGSSGVECGE